MPAYFNNLNKFKYMSILTSALYFYLFISMFFSPEQFSSDFRVPGSEPVYILVKRASMLMLGFSLLLFLVRNTPASIVRQAISFSIGINMAGFAVMSIYQFIYGFMDKSILIPAVIETLVAAGYFSFFIFDRRLLTKAN